MKTLFYLLIAIILPTLVFAQDTLYYPSDIKYHSETETYYVSNWADGEGYILRLDKDANILETFYDGLHYASGMCLVGNTLYVLDNLDLNISGGNQLPSYLIGIDMTTAEEISKVEIGPEHIYLNFVAKAQNGFLYISDYQNNIIYKYHLQNKTVTNFLTDLSTPFGICYDIYSNRMIFTENGTGLSYLKSVHPHGGEVTTEFYTDAYIKGVVMHPNADFYYTTWDVNSTQWGDEEVRKINNDFNSDYLASGGHNRPFGLCVGYDDVIAVCNWGDHTLSFLNDEVFSVEEQSSKINLYTVYPNPSNGKFNIRFYDIASNNLEISILNIAGQQVYQEKINNSDMLVEKKFHLQHLPAGTYVVILKDDHSISQEKLIIR